MIVGGFMGNARISKSQVAEHRLAEGPRATDEVIHNGHVEVIPPVVEAGLTVLYNSGITDDCLGTDRQLVAEIYRAIFLESRRQASDRLQPT
jgi:hypothetical protein